MYWADYRKSAFNPTGTDQSGHFGRAKRLKDSKSFSNKTRALAKRLLTRWRFAGACPAFFQSEIWLMLCKDQQIAKTLVLGLELSQAATLKAIRNKNI